MPKPRLVEQTANRARANRVMYSGQLLRQKRGAFAGPTQRRFGITSRRRLDQTLQSMRQIGVGVGASFATCTFAPQSGIDRGIGVLITDHNVEQTLDIVDRAYIMFEGKVQVSGPVRDLVFDDRVAQLYLGPTLTARLRARLEQVA